MTKKGHTEKVTKSGAVELNEGELDDVQGGFTLSTSTVSLIGEDGYKIGTMSPTTNTLNTSITLGSSFDTYKLE